MFCFLSREQSFLLNFAAARRNRPERCLIDSSSNAASLKSTDRRFLPRRPFFFVASAIPAWRDLRRVQISSPRSPSMPTEKRHLVFRVSCFVFCTVRAASPSFECRLYPDRSPCTAARRFAWMVPPMQPTCRHCLVSPFFGRRVSSAIGGKEGLISARLEIGSCLCWR